MKLMMGIIRITINHHAEYYIGKVNQLEQSDHEIIIKFPEPGKASQYCWAPLKTYQTSAFLP